MCHWTINLIGQKTVVQQSYSVSSSLHSFTIDAILITRDNFKKYKREFDINDIIYVCKAARIFIQARKH